MSDREAGGEVSRSRVAEWEEPRHPGTASQDAKYPTTSHSATPNPKSVPRCPLSDGSAVLEWPICRGFRGGTDSCNSGRRLHAAVRFRLLHAKLRLSERCGSPWGAMWEESLSARRERRDQRGGD